MSAQPCPDADETIYVAMLSTRKHRLSGENPTVGLFYTTDLGQTWTHTGWKQGKAFSVWAPPAACGETLWLAAGNGVMRTTDGGQSWRITTGWEVTEVQDVWSPADNPDEIWAATPYGAYKSMDFGASWEHLGGGFGSVVRGRMVGTEDGLVVDGRLGDVREPVRSIRQSPHDPSTWLVALQNGGVRISTDGAQSFAEGSPVETTIYEAEFHPTKPNTILAGGWQTGLLRSDDLGRTWTRVDALQTENIHGIAVSRSDPNTILAGSMDDGLFVSRDGGGSWSPAAPEIFDQGQIWDVHIPGE